MAIVTIETGGMLVKGEWVAGYISEITISGRYDPVGDGTIVLKRNPIGDEKQVHGYFYTNLQPSRDVRYLRLKVNEKGIDVPIICWESYQSHSIINV